MDALDRKINEVFPGKVVRKDLTALLRRGAKTMSARKKAKR